MLTGCDCLVGWAFLEQMTLASLDVGRIDVADVCVFVSVITRAEGAHE